MGRKCFRYVFSEFPRHAENEAKLATQQINLRVENENYPIGRKCLGYVLSEFPRHADKEVKKEITKIFADEKHQQS